MFIKIWQPITLYIDRMDWRDGHLTTTEGMGAGHLPTKIARRAGHLNNFFKCPRGGGMLAAGVDSRITSENQVWSEFLRGRLLLFSYYFLVADWSESQELGYVVIDLLNCPRQVYDNVISLSTTVQ